MACSRIVSAILAALQLALLGVGESPEGSPCGLWCRHSRKRGPRETYHDLFLNTAPYYMVQADLLPQLLGLGGCRCLPHTQLTLPLRSKGFFFSPLRGVCLFACSLAFCFFVVWYFSNTKRSNPGPLYVSDSYISSPSFGFSGFLFCPASFLLWVHRSLP